MNPDEPRLDEQAISRATEALLSSQMDGAETLHVDVRTNLLKIAQGQIDSVSIAGKDIVTQQDLRVQELQLRADGIKVNPMSALLGNLKLTQPIDSTGRIVVTEADINQNLNSDFFRNQCILLELEVDGQVVSLQLKPPMQIELPGDGKIVFNGTIQVFDSGLEQDVQFRGTVYPRTEQQPIRLEKFSFGPGQALSLDLMAAFLNKLKQLVNAPYLLFNETAFQVQKIDVEQGRLIIQVRAQISQIPSLS